MEEGKEEEEEEEEEVVCLLSVCVAAACWQEMGREGSVGALVLTDLTRGPCSECR